MIYVIKIEYKNIDLLKIGYTRDDIKDARYSQYKMHNPLFQVLYEISGGTEEQEKALHLKFSKYLYTGREWFEYSDEIVDYFRSHNTLDSLKDLEVSEFISENLSIKFYCEKFLNRLLQEKTSQGVISLERANESYPSMLCNLLTRKFKSLFQLEKYMIKTFNIDLIDDSLFSKSEQLQIMLDKFDELTRFPDKMKFLCDNSSFSEFKSLLNNINIKYKTYYLAFGPERLRATGYQKYRLDKEYNKSVYDINERRDKIYSEFKVGDKISLSEIKQRLSNIYSGIEYSGSPKATDLLEYFEIKEIKVYQEIDGSKKRVKAYELLSTKK